MVQTWLFGAIRKLDVILNNYFDFPDIKKKLTPPIINFGYVLRKHIRIVGPIMETIHLESWMFVSLHYSNIPFNNKKFTIPKFTLGYFLLFLFRQTGLFWL